MRILEMSQLDDTKKGKIPRHVGCIMDGNGRWAEMRKLDRSKGHAAAEESVYSVVDGALDLGIDWLSVYAFSTENWNRADAEVAFLMSFKKWLLHESRVEELDSKGVRIWFAGRLEDDRIPANSRKWLHECMQKTAANSRLNLVIAFNYGGREEIVDAVNSALSLRGGLIFDEATFARHLYIPEMPDMDVLIRTSAEERTSHFFPWHASGAELIFSETLWPDFRAWHLNSAIAEFQRRRRRRGAARSADDLR